jgi:hypothetical protein
MGRWRVGYCRRRGVLHDVLNASQKSTNINDVMRIDTLYE